MFSSVKVSNCFILLAGVPQKEVVIVGGTETNMFYTGVANQASPTATECEIASYQTATNTETNQICDFVFGRGTCCSGVKSDLTASNLCMHYDCQSNSWMPIMDIPAKLYNHRANVIRKKGRDEYWLVAGGQSKLII